jgi:DNA polymerase-1
MVKVQDRLRDEAGSFSVPPKQLLQVHDSILVECAEADADKVGKLLKDVMENIYKLPVTLDVDVSTGKNWGEL